MTQPRLLDLFCGAGGAAAGYRRAGFEVVGVDIKPQPHYPYSFILGDAIELLGVWNTAERRQFMGDFDAIHASPPCQRFTKAKKLQGNDHPDLLGPTRERLRVLGLPYVIENVPGAPMENAMLLCGTMFDLDLYRHRMFEASFDLPFMLHHPHSRKQTKMGRPTVAGEIMQVVGHFSDVPAGRRAMGIDWMTQHELAEAIPPAFTEFVGKQLMAAVLEQAA